MTKSIKNILGYILGVVFIIISLWIIFILLGVLRLVGLFIIPIAIIISPIILLVKYFYNK